MSIEVSRPHPISNLDKLFRIGARTSAAANGSRYSAELAPIVRNPPLHENNLHNFDLSVMVGQTDTVLQMKSELYAYGGVLSDPYFWRVVPWTGKSEVQPHRLLCTFISFSDHHPWTIYDEFFPAAEITRLTKRIIHRSENDLNRPLTIPEQMNESLMVVNGPYPTAAAILLHSMGRIYARGLDTTANPIFAVDQETSSRLSRSISGFEEGIDPDHFGGNYHFFGTAAAGMICVAMRKDHLIGTQLCRISALNAARFATWVREKIFRNEVLYDHKNTDRLGFIYGSSIARIHLQ
jgi:hypothetical protein